MTRDLSAEGREVLNKMIELRDLVKKYYPKATHISACAIDDGYINVFGCNGSEHIFDIGMWEGTDDAFERRGK